MADKGTVLVLSSLSICIFRTNRRYCSLVVIYGIWRQREPKLDIEQLISRLEKLLNTSCHIKTFDLDFVVEDASAVNEIVTETGFKALEKITTLFEENAVDVLDNQPDSNRVPDITQASTLPTFYACIGLASVAFKSVGLLGIVQARAYQ